MSEVPQPRIHDVAARGFERGATVYERARPSYPGPAVDATINELALRPGGLVLDLAAGTGKFTRLLCARGVHCVAVEPVPAMRATLSGLLPDVHVLDGTAEDIPLGDASVDGVTIAQAFHWFRYDEALPEIHRVMRPKTRVALIWNARDTRVDWVRRVTDLIDPYGEGAVRVPRYRDAEATWRAAMDGTSFFTPIGAHDFPYEQQMTVDGLCERMESVSFIQTLESNARNAVMQELRDLADSHPELAGRTSFAHPYVTEVYVYERR